MKVLTSASEMVHFSWCKRTNLSGEADLDLVIINDARFVPYTKTKHRGRIFALKFTSSNSRHFFWLQSGPQTRDGDASYLSDRDKKIGDAVDRLCRGEEIEIEEEVDQIRAHNGQDGDDDTMMEDADHESGPAEHLPPYSAAPQDHSTREAPGNHGAGGGSGGQA